MVGEDWGGLVLRNEQLRQRWNRLSTGQAAKAIRHGVATSTRMGCYKSLAIPIKDVLQLHTT